MNSEERIERLEKLVGTVTEEWDESTKAGLRRLLGQVLHDLRNSLSTTAIEVHLAAEGITRAVECLQTGEMEEVREELDDIGRSVSSLGESGRDATQMMARIGMVVNRA